MNGQFASWVWRRVGAAGVSLAVLLASIGMAAAQPEPKRGGPCARPERLLTPEDRQAIGDRRMARMQERLGLTQEQAKEIREVLDAQRDLARPDHQKLCEARLEMRQLLARQDADPAALKDATERVKTLQGALLDRRVDTYLALRSKLTAEQWDQWRALRHKRGHGFRGRGLAS
jgi:Spy/CpxP family protein refolding chaperone